MFELYLKHGRESVEQDMEDWGFDGPRLTGVIGLHQTYDTNVRIVFENRAAMLRAKEATGWLEWDDNSLELARCEDLVMTYVPHKRYFGDWGLWLPSAT
jgi:hypothetical protein